MSTNTKRAKIGQKRPRRPSAELDSSFILKLVLYLVIGSQWLLIANDAGAVQFPLPAGLVIGLLFARHDHFQIDRKVEYALLLVAAFVGFWAQVGLRLLV